jgi:pentapeptide MXKDX repeat protein
MKTTFATAALSACLALGTASAFAAGTMGNDKMGMGQPPASGQAMHKDKMSKDKMGMDKQGMGQAPMAKEGKSAMDPMGKKGMEKGAMGKDGMKK